MSPRVTPENRIPDIIRAAIAVFGHKGYRLAQMDEIAREADISKATLYYYFKSKLHLFYYILVAGTEDEETAPPPPESVKVRSERDFLDLLQDDLLEDTRLRSIEKFLETTGDAVNIDNELPVILEELWDICEKHRIQIIILEKSAFEFPELAEVYDTYARRRLLRQLESYLSTRIRTGAIRRLHSVPATARFILESVAWFGFKQQGIASGPIYSKAETLPDLAGILARGLKQDWRVKNTCDLEERD